jgi:hypothetical protein
LGGFELWDLIAIPFVSEVLSHLQSIKETKDIYLMMMMMNQLG